MRQQVEESDVPDFLLNSPFLPISDGLAYSYPKHIPKPRPTLRQLLLSKTFRIAVATTFALAVFLYLRTLFKKVHVLSRLTGPSCYFTTPLDSTEDFVVWDRMSVDWSQLAYVLYATDVQYLCNTVMLFETLSRMQSKAERVLMYPDTWTMDDGDEGGSVETRLLMKAREEYGVVLRPIQVQHVASASYFGPNWADSYTKLLAFNQTQYRRVIVLDSDSTVLSTMDSLFFLPPAPAIMPRAYWLSPKPILSSHIMVLTPSTSSFSLVESAISKAKYGVYDMEIMNSLFGSTCLLLPHRIYALLSGEYRSDKHESFLNLNVNLGFGEEVMGREEWNPDSVINDAKFVHFSDHPMGKPWLVGEEEVLKYAPRCDEMNDGVNGIKHECRTRDVWLDLYTDFRERRKRVCGVFE